ncbi:MAG: ATP synthase F1 subunit gamma [Candidatus Uhrbacteria bacterium]
MAVSPRLIRGRIRSVQNTKKITKAMELVAASKMRRAVAAALRTRAYAKLAWEMVEALGGTVREETHPLLRSGKSEIRNPKSESAGRVLYLVMASDRGLCGGFNAQLFREIGRDLSARATRSVEMAQWIAIGKKTEQFVRRMGWNLVASFTNIGVAPTVAELRPIARLAMDAFTNGEVDEVRIAFTDFVSSLRQVPRVRTLLPLRRIEEVVIASTCHSEGALATEESHTMANAGNGARSFARPNFSLENLGGLRMTKGGVEFLFEPDPKSVLDAMLPRLVELQVYQTYLETGASEHSARMLAMRNASDAALEMIDDLSLTLNQARQSLITREIAEISAGRAALQM